jgi:hypothetical protein
VLLKAATNEPDAPMVRELLAALCARYDAAEWLNVLRPINDEMRALQRDALVSYVLHQMRASSASAHIDTADKLFEYFLMDVQMEPCMQTSRVRHALSSVQLFIDRCLMNLEPRVASSAIAAKKWQWMNRYRVWEANRKVFLWPENWLEPELRDDQSPFFKEALSELLQGDITEERAAVTYLNYLSKLAEVAKLEPCGIHHVQNDPGTDDDIDHVVARSAGANRKYFYRRREFGYWTPWEHIKLDIEDNPVLPVVWNGRLFLFWLRLLKQAQTDPETMSASSDTSGALANLSLTQIKTDAKRSAQASAKMVVQAVLCWSEFFNGKWQPTRTSDAERPLLLGAFDTGGGNAFDRSRLQLAAMFYTHNAMRLIVSYGSEGGSSFFLHNAFSTPELRSAKKEGHFPAKRLPETSTNAFRLAYPDASIGHALLENSIEDHTVEPRHPMDGEPWDSPFFYSDARHVFYVTTLQRLVLVPHWDRFGMFETPPNLHATIPPMVFVPAEAIPDLLGPVTKQPGFGVVDPAPLEHVVRAHVGIKRGIGTLGTVRFGGKEIGPAGSLAVWVR